MIDLNESHSDGNYLSLEEDGRLETVSKNEGEKEAKRKSRNIKSLKKRLSIIKFSKPTTEQRLNSSPITKFFKYGRIPFKLITHVVLLILVTGMILCHTWFKQRFLGTAADTFTNSFLPEGFENLQDNVQGFYTFFFHEIDDVIKDIHTTVNTFETFVAENPDTFVYLPHKGNNGETVKKPIMLKAEMFHTSLRDLLNETSPINRFVAEPSVPFYEPINTSYPLGYHIRHYLTDGKREFFDRLKYLELKFFFESVDVSSIGPFMTVGECIRWEITKLYDAKVRGGHLPLKLEYNFDQCESINSEFDVFFYKFAKPILWFAIAVILLSMLSTFLTTKSIIHRAHLYWKICKQEQATAQYRYKHSNILLRGLSHVGYKYLCICDIPHFVRGWNYVTYLMDFVNMIACFLLMLKTHVDHFTLFVMGLGILFTWTHIMRYFADYPKFYTLVLAIQRAAPQIIRFFIGSFPIFMAFAVCGTILFGQYADYFEDIDDSAVTLFAAINGDAMHDIFDMLFGNDKILAYLSRAFMYTFVLLFICGVLNIFVLIMEDAFFALNKELEKQREQRENSGDGVEEEEDDRSYLAQLQDEDIFALLKFEDRRQEAHQYIDGKSSFQFVVNEESIEGNIQRMMRIMKERGESIIDHNEDAAAALTSFEEASKLLLESLSDQPLKHEEEKGEEEDDDDDATHLERLNERSTAATKFKLKDKFKNFGQ